METDFATFQDENTFDAGHGNIRCWFWVAESDAPAEDDLSLRRGDETRLGAVYLSTIRAASLVHPPTVPRRSRFLVLERDQQKFDDRAVVHLCRMQATAPCCLSFRPWHGERCRLAHDSIPIFHVTAFIHVMCWQNSTVLACEVVCRDLRQSRWHGRR